MGTPGGTGEAPHKKTLWLQICTIVVSAFAIAASGASVVLSINANANLSEAEFKREQRLTAYATFLAKEQALSNAFEAYDPSLPDESPEYVSGFTDARQAWEEFELATNIVIILESGAVEEAAGAVEKAVGAIQVKYEGIDQSMVGGLEPARDIQDARDELARLRYEFMTAARAALDE